MKCPKCQHSISLSDLRESFQCPSCKVPLHAKVNRLLLMVLFIGGIPWLVAEALIFGFSSPLATAVLLLLSYCFVLIVAVTMGAASISSEK